MQYEEKRFGSIVLEPVDLATILVVGPTNRTEAIVLGLYLAESAPTEEAEEMVLESMDPLMQGVFPDAFERFVKGNDPTYVEWSSTESAAMAAFTAYANELAEWVQSEMDAGRPGPIPVVEPNEPIES